MRRLVISYGPADRRAFGDVRAWAAEGLLGMAITVGDEPEARGDADDAASRCRLRASIEAATALVVLVGDATCGHPWVDYQLALAVEAQRDLLAVRVPGTRGPAPAAIRHLPLLPFEPRAMRQQLAALW